MLDVFCQTNCHSDWAGHRTTDLVNQLISAQSVASFLCELNCLAHSCRENKASCVQAIQSVSTGAGEASPAHEERSHVGKMSEIMSESATHTGAGESAVDFSTIDFSGSDPLLPAHEDERGLSLALDIDQPGQIAIPQPQYVSPFAGAGQALAGAFTWFAAIAEAVVAADERGNAGVLLSTGLTEP